MHPNPFSADELRTALQERIAMNFELETHATQLEELRGQFQHSIVMLQFDEPCQDCNCVMYALGFRVHMPSSPFGRFYANTNYLLWLINQGYLVEATQPPVAGFLVIYCGDDKVAHVGIVRAGGLIASKWGIGFLYEHEIWEVPSSYGTSIRYFMPIDPDQALDLLESFLSGK